MSFPRAPLFLLVAVLAAPLAAAAQNELPDGDAKEAVQAMCVQCHQIGRVTGMHLSREEWKTTVEDMIRMGANIPPDWVDPLADYLGEHFPPKAESGSAAKIDLAMTVEPLSPAATKADPAVSSRGVAFAVQARGNTIGGVDPITHAVREYSLPRPDAQPRGIAVGSDDAIWYSDGRGFLGRLDPTSGQIREWPSPGGGQSQPGGLAVLNEGVWYVENGSHRLVRFDPKTETFAAWPLPPGIDNVARVVKMPDGTLAMTEPGSGRMVVAAVK